MDPYFYMNQQHMYPRQPVSYKLAIATDSDQLKSFALGRDLSLPLEVHVYHSLVPLDAPQIENAASQNYFYGHPSSVYKATCSVDGRTYTLVRIEGFRLVNELAMTVVEAWRRIRHCNIVSVQETLWSYITQIASALKTIHGSGLAARNIDLKKILMTGKNRLLQFDNEPSVARQQQEDLLSFAKLIMALACHSLQSHNDLMHAFEYISHHYSPDVKNLLLYILSNPSTPKSIDEVLAIIGPRILHEINNCHFYNDELESELSRELENGRLVRLMSKMGFINERPEFDMDPGWSETGDRYLIKLFRDYVFHQVDEKGQPVIDMVHVLTCLNKLDAGVDEKIMLMSRDEQSCLIVSFKEIKNCIMSAFNDLTSGRK
ncbi:hypothetical protein BD560DRAFT_417449 [Blakeslea trispora]|nr:hypothetical protein BD560DRAFT_417449 [Blakeslea trispora]